MNASIAAITEVGMAAMETIAHFKAVIQLKIERIEALEKENAELKSALAELRQRKGNRVILMDKIPHHTSGGDL